MVESSSELVLWINGNNCVLLYSDCDLTVSARREKASGGLRTGEYVAALPQVVRTDWLQAVLWRGILWQLHSPAVQVGGQVGGDHRDGLQPPSGQPARAARDDSGGSGQCEVRTPPCPAETPSGSRLSVRLLLARDGDVHAGGPQAVSHPGH